MNPHLLGAFEAAGPGIVLSEDFLLRTSSLPLHIASTLVHESAHARIAAAGIAYSDQYAVRIERACTREEIRFVSVVGAADAGAFLKSLDTKYRSAAQVWAPGARVDRTQSGLAAAGAPAWVRRFFQWLRHAA